MIEPARNSINWPAIKLKLAEIKKTFKGDEGNRKAKTRETIVRLICKELLGKIKGNDASPLAGCLIE